MHRMPATARRALAILLAFAGVVIATSPNLLAATADCDKERETRRADKNLPRGGAYVLLDRKGEIVRSGKAKNLLSRCRNHASDKALRDYTFVAVFRSDNANNRTAIEQVLDEQVQPPLNKIRAVKGPRARDVATAVLPEAVKAGLAKVRDALAPFPAARRQLAGAINQRRFGAPLRSADRVVVEVYHEGDSPLTEVLSENVRASRSGNNAKIRNKLKIFNKLKDKVRFNAELLASPAPRVALYRVKLPAKGSVAPDEGLGSTVAANVAAAEANVTADADIIDEILNYVATINPTADIGLVGTASVGAAVDESTRRAREANPARPRVVSAMVMDSPNLPAPKSTEGGAGRAKAKTGAETAARAFNTAIERNARPRTAKPSAPSAPPPPPASTRPAVVLPPAFQPPGSATLVGSINAAQRGDLGGIDFSSLELRYIADASTQTTRATAFAFKGVPGPSGRGGAKIARRVMRQSSDAFFVWLALPTTSFTVNLNPSEPNRIVDPKLGRTDAGRILLEADLTMKKTVARLIHPRRRLGARFWAALGHLYDAHSARICLSFRQWIVPAPATVSENRGELYILKAPLYVKMESDYRSTRAQSAGGQRGCPGQSQALQQRAEALYRRMILPHVQRAVRSRPEYAALRRVYLARVAAEWYRRLGAREGGAFVEIIDSGDISRWRSKRAWRPRDVFDRYVRSFRRGEFRVTRHTRQGNLISTSTLVYGGVDFTNAPLKTVSATELRSLRPELPAMLVRALSRPVVDRNRGETWLAGASVGQTFATSEPELDEDSSPRSPLIAIAGVLLLVLAAATVVVVRRAR
jgi:hypothetical protein